MDARIAERQKELDGLVVQETRLTKSLQLLDDPSSIIPALNALTASRKSAQQEIDELLFQQKHAVAMVKQMHGLDSHFLREWERLDALTYDERRAKLREFNVGVTLGSAITSPGLRLLGL